MTTQHGGGARDALITGAAINIGYGQPNKPPAHSNANLRAMITIQNLAEPSRHLHFGLSSNEYLLGASRYHTATLNPRKHVILDHRVQFAWRARQQPTLRVTIDKANAWCGPHVVWNKGS